MLKKKKKKKRKSNVVFKAKGKLKHFTLFKQKGRLGEETFYRTIFFLSLIHPLVFKYLAVTVLIKRTKNQHIKHFLHYLF